MVYFHYYRPPEGGRLYVMKVVSGYAFLRTYFVPKKLTANHAAAISHKNCSRNSTVSVRRREPSVWLHDTQLSRDAYIIESRLFMYILNNSDILFRFG